MNPHPRAHIVYPYTDEKNVTGAVRLFASTGLRNMEAVVLIMTQDHFEPIKNSLAADGLNVDLLESKGQLTCLEAGELLSQLLVDDMPDAAVFRSKIGNIIELAKASVANGHPPKVRVFGEMVSLLWSNKRQRAAECLEELWNEAIDKHSIALMCTYNLCGPAHQPLSPDLFRLHSHTAA